MTIDPKKHLVIIKGKDHTEDVLQVARAGERTVVIYRNGMSYRYAPKNVEWLSNPERLPVDHSRLFIAGDMLSGVAEVLRFGNWVKVFRTKGDSLCCRFSQVSIQRMTSSKGHSKDILAYYCELAEGIALRTGDGDSLLAMKYRHLDIVSHRSILSSFLQARLPSSEETTPGRPLRPILPFGSNISQKKAVERALQNRISIVQGPPGTGKTQTILNLIGNLLLQNKRVAVVSNNNAATANVLEKLKKYDIDFVAAFLGSTENKRAFIEKQTDTAVRMPRLLASEESSLQEELGQLNQEIDKAFEANNELADVIQQSDALRLELAHFKRLQNEAGRLKENVGDRPFRPKVSTRTLIKYWVACDDKAKRRATVKARRFSNDERPPISASPAVPRRKVGFLDKLFLLLRFGRQGRVLFDLSVAERIPLLQKAYYLRKLEELESRRKRLEVALERHRFEEHLERLTELSMRLLKNSLGKRYNTRKRKIFTLEDLWKRPRDFLDNYPVVLSTTFSVITSVKNSDPFDCLIVDEASQVDLLNGVLAMGCAKTLVIVGDPMQLPNVLTEEDEKRAAQVALNYDLPKYARFERHNLLSAIRAAFPEVRETLLREHYRCHPKIIQFCNQKFYGGELVVMTRDRGEPDVLKAYITVAGRHARGTFNQRQIDEIVQNVLPELGSIKPSDIGIVSPYRAQTARMRASAGTKEIEVDTVHKYQGREKPVMIITTVANEANEFVDNPNLLNVAVSRAQEKVRLVVSKEIAEDDGNIADLVRYIRYNNFEVVPGRVRSIFDLLYGDYTAIRLKTLKKRKRVSEYDSENLAHAEIEAALQEQAYRGYGVVSQYPLSKLIRNTGQLTTDESTYANHPWTRIDFLIFRRVDKYPVLVVEVDGYAFHRKGTRQSERDALKDSILTKSGLPILRLSTVESNERNRIREKLGYVVGAKSRAMHGATNKTVTATI